MTIKCERIKLGRRLVGGLYEAPSGPIFMAYRWIADIYRGAAKDISTAIRDDSAMWTIEEDILRRMRRQGVTLAGVIVRDTGDRYIATLPAWFDLASSRLLALRGRSGSHRGLFVSAMTRRAGKRPKKL